MYECPVVPGLSSSSSSADAEEWRESELYKHCVGLRQWCLVEGSYAADGPLFHKALRWINQKPAPLELQEADVKEFRLWNESIQNPWHSNRPPCLCKNDSRHVCEVCYQCETGIKRPWYLSTPPIIPKGNLKYLCEDCCHIDFQYFQNYNHTFLESPRLSIPLGFLEDVLARAHYCAFCRLLVGSLQNSFGVSRTFLEAKGPYVYGMIVSSARDPYRLRVEFHTLPLRLPVIDRRLVDAPLPPGEKQKYRFDIHGVSLTPKPGYGRLRAHSGLNFRLIKRWIDSCDPSESDDSLVAEWGRELSIRLYDVRKECIVEGSIKYRYLTLSYVWGGPQQFQSITSNKAAMETPGNLQMEKLPATLKDAAFLVSQIGERYIWIDSLCIIQDDPEFKHSQIASMNLIYQFSIATIVAAYGTTAHDGLPGIRPRSWNQHCEEIQGSLLANCRPHSNPTEWDTRAWTFQEEKLSRRLLTFGIGGVIFRNESGFYHEDTFEPNLRPLTSTHPLLAKELENKVNFTCYHQLVYDYTQRKISFHTDALNAFSGILGFLKTTFRSEFVFGLPLSEIDAALLWRPRIPLKRRLHPSTSEPLFPSWCWAAWSGHICYFSTKQTEHIGRVMWVDPGSSDTYATNQIRLEKPEEAREWIKSRDANHVPYYTEKGQPQSKFLHPITRRWKPSRQFAESGKLNFVARSALLHIGRYTLGRDVPGDMHESYTQSGLTIFTDGGFAAGLIFLNYGSARFDQVTLCEFICLSQSRLEYQTTSEFATDGKVTGQNQKSPDEWYRENMLSARAYIESTRRGTKDRSPVHEIDTPKEVNDLDNENIDSTITEADDCSHARLVPDAQEVDEKIRSNYPNIQHSSAYFAYEGKVNRDVPFDRNVFDEFKKWCLYNVMLVERDDSGAARRIGIGVCHVDAFTQAGPLRKHITLV